MNGTRSILYFTNSTVWGGVEEHICGLLTHLSRRLFRPHLVCAPAIFERFRAASPGDVEITPLPLHCPADIRAGAQLATLLVRAKFDIVHSHMFWSSLCASPIAWACRVPAIVETLHGGEAWRCGWKAHFWVDRAVSHFVSKHVAVSASDARFLGTRKHVPSEKISTIYNGVDLRRFDTSRAARNTMRNALGLADDDVVLIMVARFHSGKGHPVLLHAMRDLLDRRASVKLICLGEGEEEVVVRRLCHELGLARHVKIEGYQPNVAEWLQAADINVLPTYYEGLPLTVLEAMASALPTVASNVGGIPELVEDGVSGRLVPPGEPESLADALSMLLSQPELRKRMGRAAYSRVSRCFSLDQQVRNTERLYLELCGAPLIDEPRQIAVPVITAESEQPTVYLTS
ncbi:MAG: glycosyltransferase family 4 protein [Terracidiphilus sp.]